MGFVIVGFKVLLPPVSGCMHSCQDSSGHTVTDQGTICQDNAGWHRHTSSTIEHRFWVYSLETLNHTSVKTMGIHRFLRSHDVRCQTKQHAVEHVSRVTHADTMTIDVEKESGFHTSARPICFVFRQETLKVPRTCPTSAITDHCLHIWQFLEN